MLAIGSVVNMIKEIYNNNYKNHIKSFTFLSRYGDKPNYEYLVKSELKAFNFDGITKLFCKKKWR